MSTTAFSILAYSVVLAETCLAVGVSTIAPATFVELARLARRLALTNGNASEIDGMLDQALKLLPPLPGMPKPGSVNYADAIKPWKTVVQSMVKESDKIQLLVPKAATIDAEFSCSGGESYGANAGAEGVIQVVGVKAGFSALFEMKSSTNIRLHMEFAPVEYALS